MKYFLCTILYFLMTYSLIASDPECVTSTSTFDLPTLEEALMAEIEVPYDLFNHQIVLPIVTHIIRDDNGNGGLSTPDLATALNKLDGYYDQLNISFDHKYNTYIDKSAWLDQNTADNQADIIRGTNNDPNAINIYFLPQVTNSSYFPNNTVQGILVENNKAVNGSTLAHEMGHYLFLFHTFETYFGTHCIGSTDCETKGDLVCDTEFDTETSGGWLNPDCTVRNHKPNKDACGNTANPDYFNIMNYNQYTCRDEFTIGQHERILKTLIKYYPEYIYESFLLVNEKNEVNLGGNLTIVEKSETKASGQSVGLIPFNFYNVKTENERFGSNKHHHWNSDNNSHFLENYFEAIVGESDQKAKFYEIKHATLNVCIDGTPIPGQGELYFHDSWYLKSDGTQPDDYLPFTSPYEPNGKEGASEKGVFLEQDPQTQSVFYSVKVAATQNIIYNGNKTLYFQNWISTDDNVVEPNNLINGFYETPVIFKNEDDTINANYKGTQLSNNSLAFSHNNQRKIVKTDNGNLHMVYESMGKVWYERSTDDGVTWTLMNSGQPISSYDAKLPSIDYGDGDNNKIVIVYQEKNGTYSKIQLKIFNNGSPISTHVIYNGYSVNYSSDAFPVIAFGRTSNDQLMIVWEKENTNLQYWIGKVNFSTNIFTNIDEGAIPNTSSNSTKPSIVINRSAGNSSECYLVWQQDTTSGSSIEYLTMGWDDGKDKMYFQHHSVPSSNSGYDDNFNPSIAITNNQPRVVWLTDAGRRIEGNLRTRLYGITWSTTTTKFNNGSRINIESIVVNSLNLTSGYVAAYAGEGKRVRYYKDDGTNTYVQPLIYDNFVQLSNGTNYTDMMIAAINTSSAPYYFTSSLVDATLSKTSPGDDVIKGREIILTKGKSNLIFEVNNIIVDNEVVDFIEVEDTVITKSNEETISLFETKEFLLTDNSNFSFNVNYSLIEKEKLVKHFNFEFQLVDAKTNKTIGVLEKLETSKLISDEFNSISFGIDTKGIGNERVKLKLVVDKTNAEKISIANTYSIDETLPKESSKTVAFNETLAITDYSLSQNYPNPFNPSTVINYQIPVNGFVSLKLYDITGREVTTLVNRSQTKGRYEIKFDASNLSSGVYFYRLQSVPSSSSGQGFVKTMKMLLLK